MTAHNSNQEVQASDRDCAEGKMCISYCFLHLFTTC